MPITERSRSAFPNWPGLGDPVDREALPDGNERVEGEGSCVVFLLDCGISPNSSATNGPAAELRYFGASPNDLGEFQTGEKQRSRLTTWMSQNISKLVVAEKLKRHQGGVGMHVRERQSNRKVTLPIEA